ncbi:hypothetical protein FISHEDRAFT_77425 [Fistulina hepatica ATCC 64428]|uniref:Uncharacterized protein n=1 Tax=Fistulina hepatica ATCC 64428 TaxID=1128425 RepID=A0A0D7A129_9AGAR|nr:hypothetical protein FISHEDRAFT_77425 [Fistulina hepatica ATCC 64428]
MAAALQSPGPDRGQAGLHAVADFYNYQVNFQPQLLPLDFTIGGAVKSSTAAPAPLLGTADRPALASTSHTIPNDDQCSIDREAPQEDGPRLAVGPRSSPNSDGQSRVSYIIPPASARRVVERYSLDERVDEVQIAPSRSPSAGETPNPTPRRNSLRLPPAGNHNNSPIPNSVNNVGNYMPPVSTTYDPPVSSNPRATPQQPTFITNNPPPMSRAPPQEEVCIECTMRDQDMADVDVTSPGVWDRESDVLYEDLKRREQEEAATGSPPDDLNRPKSYGDKLSEKNLRLWLDMNPKEPTQRGRTMSKYVKAQRALLEAEALAHAQAMQEARQLDSKMRDRYSQLRRSAYDLKDSHITDEAGGVRIRPPRSLSSPSHMKSHSRDVTLLENGMIVEHVDVKREEREARERRKREEKRARKLSRGSVMDVTSIASTQSYGGPLTEYGLRASHYSQAGSPRPTSTLTAPADRAMSQASFSDVHSLGTPSSRMSRYFGLKNISSSGIRSRDSLAPSGMSGSMIDMHVALQREAAQAYPLTPDTLVDLNSIRHDQVSFPTQNAERTESQPSGKAKKKKGWAKVWNKMTGGSKRESASGRATSQGEPTDDDLPLAPPPPLSYLMSNRGRSSDLSSPSRLTSTPSLPSLTFASPKVTMSSCAGMSSPVTPSSTMASPVSLRMSGHDLDVPAILRKANGTFDEQGQSRIPDEESKGQLRVQPRISEPDMRRRLSSNLSNAPPVPTLPTMNSATNTLPRPGSVLMREKALPPLPAEAQQRPMTAGVRDPRPRTLFTYDPRHLQSGTSPSHGLLPPRSPFRTPDSRRQSFNGLSNRLNVAQTMPVSGYDPSAVGQFYDDFGRSRRSLGRLDFAVASPKAASAPPSKRKSRFGLSALLGGRKRVPSTQLGLETGDGAHPNADIRVSRGSDVHDDSVGYATSTSRHSAFSTSGMQTPGLRASIVSRKPLEDLVAQDPEFVAYRYPSSEQRLDLFQ